MVQYEKSINLWNKIYSDYELADLSDITLHVEPHFDACLQTFSEHAKRVLDFGCGTGDVLFQCQEFGNLEYGMGIDRSKTGITYCREMTELNQYQNLEFVVGDTKNLKLMEDGSFDGIIISNVLDVVPKEVETEMLQEVTRILTNDGYLFVKLNPYATKETLDELGLVQMGNHLYEEDGVLRLRNLHTAFWKKIFEERYSIEQYIEFEYPWQEGQNRLFLLHKKSIGTKKDTNNSRTLVAS